MYNVKIRNLLINRGDNDLRPCSITSICMLPNGNILLVDDSNRRLKKLDSSYNVVSHCDIPGIPYDVCYIGDDDRAAISLRQKIIQFVNVTGRMKLGQAVKLDHRCDAVAFHGDTLYVTGGNAIYTYNRDCQQKHILFRSQELETYILNNGVAVSDCGQRIYIACGTTGLITIDKTGNRPFTLMSNEWKNCKNVCVVGDGTVLLLDEAGRVYQVDYRGKQVLGTVVYQSDGLSSPMYLCYDRQQCRIIVANVEGGSITVSELKYHNSGTYMS